MLISKNAKEKDIEDIIHHINNGKHSSGISKTDIGNAFKNSGIEISEKELEEMMEFVAPEGNKEFVTKEEFKAFFI